jgi:hypothetical protein
MKYSSTYQTHVTKMVGKNEKKDVQAKEKE